MTQKNEIKVVVLSPNTNPDVLKFREICKDMAELFERKNADYGNSFEQSLDKFGLTASAVRISDKLNRFANLIKHDAKVKDESLVDTLTDLANYSVMTLIWLSKQE